MSEDLHEYDDFFRKKLENYESLISDDLFDKLMSDRFVRGQLADYESNTPEHLFDKLIREREGSDEIPSDAPLREFLTQHISDVPNETFDTIIIERERRWRVLLWRSAAILCLLLGSYFVFVKNINTSDAVNAPNNAQAAIINKQNNKNTEGWGTAYKNLDIDNNTQLEINNKKTNNNFDAHNYRQLTISDKQPNTVSDSTNYITLKSTTQQAIIPKTTIPTTTQLAEGEDLNYLFKNQPQSTQVEKKEMRDRASGAEHNILTDNSIPEFQNSKLTEGGALSKVGQVFGFENLEILKIKNIALPHQDFTSPCGGPDNGCPTFRKHNIFGGIKTFFVDAYVAPEYAYRHLSENLPEMTAYLTARDTTEKSWYALSTGVRASMVFANGLALRTGIIYTQTNEKAIYDSLGIGGKDVHETYTPRAGGGFDTVRTTVITSGIFRTTAYNRYHSFDIPLQVGFEFPLNDVWSFGVNGGVNFNITAWRKALIVGNNLKKQDVSSDIGVSNPVYRNTLGVSLFGSFAAYRQLTDRLQFVIEPSVRHYLKPITRSDYGLNQRYTNMGLILALRYRF